MSIPPLVCSTPPPPEQCEDDKDHEDFDISYNLSQEDDEDCSEYNYGNYSYNIYNKSEDTEHNKWPSSVCEVSVSQTEIKDKSEKGISDANFISSNELHQEHIITSEENVIEDLNLVIHKNITQNDISTKEYDIEDNTDSDSSENDTRIQDEGGTNNSLHDNSSVKHNSPLIIKLIVNDDKISQDSNEDNTFNVVESSNQHMNDTLSSNDSNETETSENTENTFANETVVQSVSLDRQDNNSKNNIDKETNKILADPVKDDEFGDFEDFQVNSTNCKPPLPLNNENPWVNTQSDSEKTPEFGDFTTNFNFQENPPEENIDNVSSKVRETETVKPREEEGSDDFGDFDDYRSSENTEAAFSEKEVTSAPDITVWNLHSSENDPHIVDGIDNMLTSIFISKVPEPEEELVVKLESFLRETWGHLIDIDVRQPYMVNWNNSLGQKTLLKALCIDSRNILFGPKWNNSMPKYASNLTAAPLQPKKQITQTNSSNIDCTEKVTTKETGGWVDPFTPDGQESCHTENETGVSETAKRPTDLNVLETDTSTKLNKIYSSTINVQPLRHINLPDTHIFTPTDSETPRSKTIHYDNRPALTLPKNAEDNVNQSEKTNSQFNDPVDGEYWEFQDFKGTNAVPTTVIQTPEEPVSNVTKTSVLPNTGVTYQTQILQPIKLEPVIPTLNWPDPGEVKETFDDFSDFISNTKWGNESENQATSFDEQPITQNSDIPNSDNASAIENIDDEFETFQSASMSNIVKDFSLNSIGKLPSSVSKNSMKKDLETCDNVSSKVENNSVATSNNAFTELTPNTPKCVPSVQNFTFPHSSFVNHNSSEVLQPSASTSTTGFSRNQQQSGQILQPLTLESYSQINWPNPGIDLQDLSRFNPINSLNSLKSDINTSGNSKNSSPSHNFVSSTVSQSTDDEIWGDFVSSAPKPQEQSPAKAPTFVDDDEWTDFVSSPNIKPQNGLNTISFNVHTNLSMQKPSNQNKFGPRNSQIPLDIPTLNYITPKSNNRGMYAEKHFQNL